MFKSSPTFAVTSDYPDTMSLADAVSVAHSQVTNFSVGFRANFEWLFLPHSSDLNEEAWKDKENEILDCLQGTNDVVDLWKLRELALSKGGLLTPNLRKRAWLKLAACHEQILSPKQYQPLVDPSGFDIEVLQRDVSKTIWNVEEHLVASKKEQKEQDEKLQQFLELQKQRGRKRVSFAPMTHMASPIAVSSSDPPQTIATSPITDDEDEKNDDSSNLSCDDMGGAFSPERSVMTQETNFTLSSRVVRWRKASRQEQKILFNVITAVLRTEAAPSTHFEDDNYHYFSGLQDITALLMINLESPSLTSMVLNRLAEGHLRDSMRSDRLIAEIAIAHVFMPLLESVDSKLYDHLYAAGMILPTFARQWIMCWFAQDVPNVQVASRIMDVLMASHPLMPVYMAVAILTVNRSRIFDAQHQLSALYATMRNLPMQNLASTDGDSLKHAEEVIETAVSYMKRFNPVSLLAAANNRMDPNDKVKAFLPAIAMFRDPPAWTTAADAPSDWALLQRAKVLRLQKARFEEEKAQVEIEVDKRDLEALQNKPDLTEYPLAVAAAGLAPSSHHSRKSSLHFGFVALLVVCLMLLSATTTTSSSSLFRPAEKEPSGPQLFLPSTKRQTKKIFGLVPTVAAVENERCSAPVISTTNNSIDTGTKPTTVKVVPSIVEASGFMVNLEFTATLTDSYYALGSYFADKSHHVLSFLRVQLVKLRGVWDEKYDAVGTFVADEHKPEHFWSMLHRQLMKVPGVVRGVVPLS